MPVSSSIASISVCASATIAVNVAHDLSTVGRPPSVVADDVAMDVVMMASSGMLNSFVNEL